MRSIQLPPVTTVEEAWQGAKRRIQQAARAQLGVTKPHRLWIDKQAWLWTDEVEAKVRKKKRLYYAFLESKSAETWRRYGEAKKAAKRSIAAAKSAHYDKLMNKLERRNGERSNYRLVEHQRRQAKGVEKFYGVNDEQGYLITDRIEVLKRWREYFKAVCNEEFSHPPLPRIRPTQGPVQQITPEEVTRALKKMKSGKVTGPDDVAAELWKSQHWDPTQWLTRLFNAITQEKQMPEEWQRSTTIPIWKGKGNPADCTNYRPIRLLSHSMKVFERVIACRIRDVVRITTNQ